MKKDRRYYDAMVKALYHEQIVEEACNGNIDDNHFRKTLSVEDCVIAVAEAHSFRLLAEVYR